MAFCVCHEHGWLTCFEILKIVQKKCDYSDIFSHYPPVFDKREIRIRYGSGRVIG